MKLLAYTASALFIANAAVAQTEALEESCKSNFSEFNQRLADCTALIEIEDYPDMTWAYERRGDAYKDNSEYDAAVADFDRALALDPEYKSALSGRVYSLSELDRPQEALANILLLGEIEPDDDWNFYFHGVLLGELDRYEEALVPLSRAVEMDSEDYYNRYERAKTYHQLGRYAPAIEDYHVASAARPLSYWPYLRMGRAYLDIGDRANAAKYYRMVQIINPNRRGMEGAIADIIQLKPDIELPPAPYQKPANGLKIRYLQSFLPFDTRDEMEQAIGALADWFKAPAKAMPEALAFISREISHQAGETIRIIPDLEEGKNTDELLPNGRLPAFTDTYRGLFLTGVRPDGEDGPNFGVVIDTANPADLWPLKVGNTIEGTGRMLIICPDKFQMAALLVGCKHGVVDVTMGKIEYSLLVEKTEQVHVPMGVFDTYVVRFRQLSRMESFGREMSRNREIRWWISPELGFWVKRTNRRGDKIANVYAVEMVEE